MRLISQFPREIHETFGDTRTCNYYFKFRQWSNQFMQNIHS